MTDELLLLSRNDIPFVEAQVSIHNPTIKEIALVGEEDFHIGVKFLNFSKKDLDDKDKVNLENTSDFDIFMSMVNNEELKHLKIKVLMILALLFPDYNIKITSAAIVLKSADEGSKAYINALNFEEFKSILTDMFCLKGFSDGKEDFNPADRRAEIIAKKLQEARNRKNKKAGQKNNKMSIFSRYVSILAVGLQKDMNELLNYSVYQLYDEFNRFTKKQASDINMKARLAGATGLDEVDNWMDDIHP